MDKKAEWMQKNAELLQKKFGKVKNGLNYSEKKEKPKKTNAELNAWYDKEVLGNCPHKSLIKIPCELPAGLNVCSGFQRKCECGFVTNYCDSTGWKPHMEHELKNRIPDHLSDPAVMWGILKKWIADGHCLYEITEQWSHTMPGEYTEPSDDFLARAVMLALKAKVEG